MAILATLAVFFAIADFRRHSGKVTLLANQVVRGFDRKGVQVVSPARFRFQNYERKVFGLAATSTAWSFVVLTNNGRGRFVAGFEPNEASFNTANANTYDFWVRDARLLDYEWKVHVVRKVRYKVPRIFSFLASTVPGPDDIWVSEAIKPPLDKWKFEPVQQEAAASFRFPDRPTPTNEQPSFLTNSGTIFGERGLHYTQ